MNEIPKPVSPKDAGGTSPGKGNAPVAASPVPVSAPVGVPAGSSVVPFGGHRGGGKKRLDGLIAGSAEAEAADKKKDADRKANERAAKKVATRPPTLPSATHPPVDSSAPLAAGTSVLSGAALAAPVAGSPAFVPWHSKLLEKPARLITKIIDRVRCHALMQRIRKLDLDKAQEKEILDGLKWQAATVEDFNTSLAECSAAELNKHRASGSQYSHWIGLAISSGELVLAHMDTIDRLEKMMIENASRKNPATKTGP